jgi:hypothetical protein
VGTRTVSCTVTDRAGNSSTGSFVLTVIDGVAPAGTCTPSVNPSLKNAPAASKPNQDGFYLVGATDNIGVASITLGSFALRASETIKLTQTPSTAGVRLENLMGQGGIRHFLVGVGDAMFVTKDAAGNSTSTVCPVPPRQK